MTEKLDSQESPPRRPARRRGKAEIWSGILELCTRTWRTQTWLRRKMGLKTETVRVALSFLLKADLLEQRNNPNTQNMEYSTNKRGETALAQYYLLFTKYFTP